MSNVIILSIPVLLVIITIRRYFKKIVKANINDLFVGAPVNISLNSDIAPGQDGKVLNIFYGTKTVAVKTERGESIEIDAQHVFTPDMIAIFGLAISLSLLILVVLLMFFNPIKGM